MAVGRRRVAQSAMEIAGLKTPPEMCPSAVTINAIARPCANATPTIPEPTITAPTPMKMSAKVPMNSAMSLRPRSRSIAPPPVCSHILDFAI